MELNIYKNVDGKLVLIEDSDDISDAIWVDAINPSSQTIDQLNSVYDLKIPTEDTIQFGKDSLRFEHPDGTFFFVANLLSEKDGVFHNAPVLFVANSNIFITIRETSPNVFTTIQGYVANSQMLSVDNAIILFFEIMFSLFNYYSKRSEEMSEILDQVAHEVFTENLDGQNSRLHKNQINRIAITEDLNSRIMNSLMGLSLLGDYLETLEEIEFKSQAKRFESNIESLINNSEFISDRIDFVLNSVISVINLEQNRVVNVFSVFTVIFTIPALLAGIWGMNFSRMPELQWPYGYFIGLCIIVISGLVPYWFVKKRGWL